MPYDLTEVSVEAADAKEGTDGHHHHSKKRKKLKKKIRRIVIISLLGLCGCAVVVWGLVKLFSPTTESHDPYPKDYQPAKGIQASMTSLNYSSSRSLVGIRVVGGTEATPHSQPHQVSLQLRNGDAWYHICGGSLVENGWKIILAAHCVHNGDPANFRIVAGDHDLFDAAGTEQTSDVDSIHIHPNYDPVTIDFDYALLFLSDPLQLNDQVQPIPIASKYLEPSGFCLTSGWGNTATDGGVSQPGVLQQVTLSIMERPECVRVYDGINSVTKSMICAAGPNKGPCTEDSGGPLVCEDDNSQKYLAGLVSWGMTPCGQYPGVFANMAAGREWFDKIKGT